MKQIIKINRNDIKQLVKESIYKILLNEAKSVDSLIQSFVNKNPNINTDELRQLFQSDPTSVTNNNGEFVGKYATWIGNLYVQNKLKLSDVENLKNALNIYNINKSQLPNIKTFKTLPDLINVIKDYSDDFKAERTISKGEQECELVYEDDTWKVYVPHTYEASRWIGGDTKWCTASSNPHYFSQYTEKGPLYVNINKQTGEKYQIHFETGQFKDSYDEDILDAGLPAEDNELCWPFDEDDAVLNFYRNMGELQRKAIDERIVCQDTFANGTYMFFGDIFQCDGICFGLFDKNFNLIEYFWTAKLYNSGLWLVENENYEENLIKPNGEYVCDFWLDYIEGAAAGKDYFTLHTHDHKYNIANLDGKLINDTWRDESELYRKNK